MRSPRFLVCVHTVILFFLATPVYASEQILHMDVDATVSQNRQLIVTEAITYDFGTHQQHGIYRIIPDIYRRNETLYRLNLDVQEVTMDGQTVPWKIERSPSGLEIRVGDPSIFVSATHTYRLTYVTSRAVNSFPEGDEVYWNVTGDAWDVRIQDASFTLHAPTSSLAILCFTGSIGSTDKGCSTQISAMSSRASTTQALQPREGFTVAVRLPSGTVKPISWYEHLGQLVVDNRWLLLPGLLFILMFCIWFLRGREPKGKGVVIPHYESPNDFPPAMLVSLMDQHMSQRAVTATLFDLARRGYLTIHLTPTIRFSKREQNDLSLHPFERVLYDALFLHRTEVTMTELQGDFWKAIERARAELFQELRDLGFFGKNPSVVRTAWSLLAVVCLFIGLMGVGSYGLSFLWSLIATSAIIFFFGWQMPRMTKRGAILKEEAIGFRLFLSVTEKARLDFTDAPERTPTQFALFLPSAVAFGVEEKWAKQFSGLAMQPPSYVDGTWNGMSALAFAQALTQFHQTTSASSYSAPSSAGSGGSGFSGGGSGGGFGGGGGGSW